MFCKSPHPICIYSLHNVPTYFKHGCNIRKVLQLFSCHIFCYLCHFLFLLCGSMMPQPSPASAGEESEEDQQFRTIFQEIAGDVSTRRATLLPFHVDESVSILDPSLLLTLPSVSAGHGNHSQRIEKRSQQSDLQTWVPLNLIEGVIVNSQFKLPGVNWNQNWELRIESVISLVSTREEICLQLTKTFTYKPKV